MTPEQLRIFIAVAECEHVTHAARKLGITQSAASAAIAALERQYSAVLFDRLGRGIRLNEMGRLFLPEAHAVLNRMAAARAVLNDISGRPAGCVSIAASQTIANYWLPRRLATYHKQFPEVRLDVVIGNTRQVESAVVEGSSDLGLVEGPTVHSSLIRRPVGRDRLVLVVATSLSPIPLLASGRPDLRAITWVIREAGSGTRATLEKIALDDGITFDELRVFLVLPSNEAVREAVEAGAGATIISEHVVAREIRERILRAVPIDLPPREFALVRHAERRATLAQRALIDCLLLPT